VEKVKNAPVPHMKIGVVSPCEMVNWLRKCIPCVAEVLKLQDDLM
jgi:hypothetical protein